MFWPRHTVNRKWWIDSLLHSRRCVFDIRVFNDTNQICPSTLMLRLYFVENVAFISTNDFVKFFHFVLGPAVMLAVYGMHGLSFGHPILHTFSDLSFCSALLHQYQQSACCWQLYAQHTKHIWYDVKDSIVGINQGEAITNISMKLCYRPELCCTAFCVFYYIVDDHSIITIGTASDRVCVFVFCVWRRLIVLQCIMTDIFLRIHVYLIWCFCHVWLIAVDCAYWQVGCVVFTLPLSITLQSRFRVAHQIEWEFATKYIYTHISAHRIEPFVFLVVCAALPNCRPHILSN